MVSVDVRGIGAPPRIDLRPGLSAAMAKARGEDFWGKYKWYVLGGAGLLGAFLLLKK